MGPFRLHAETVMKIEPALTREQWAGEGPTLKMLALATHTPDQLFMRVAMFNDALPDDDPRKITSADVVLLWRAFADTSHREYADLAVKLNALLPPV